MDSESSSSTSSDTNQTDNRRVLGQGALSAETGGDAVINLTTLDAEVANHAISNAGTNLEAALGFAKEFTGKAFGFSTDSQKTALDSLDTQANLVKDAYADAKGRGALTDKILIGAIAMAGIVAFAAVRGK
ncbi:hypothetical protein [Polaromonas sp.]|uniref:hypothetical protein n=1 Tax=Polaromonas sp. TaxID=1869339 RepID=UPI003C836C4C